MSTKAYYETAANALRGLEEGQDRCSERLAKGPPPAERFQIKIRIAMLDGEWQKVYQGMLAVAQKAVKIASPTPEQVKRAREIADELDKLIINDQTLGAVIGATTEIMSIWNATLPEEA
jgi:hypothetical protein